MLGYRIGHSLINNKIKAPEYLALIKLKKLFVLGGFMYVHTHTYMHTHTIIPAHATYTHACTYLYTHTCSMYTYTHAYTCAQYRYPIHIYYKCFLYPRKEKKS